MPDCPHKNFAASVAVNRIEEVRGFNADVSIQCADCNERFVFVGLPVGAALNVPMMSFGGHEARLPIRPASDAYRDLHGPSFGLTNAE